MMLVRWGVFFFVMAVVFWRGNRFFLLFHEYVDLTDQKSDIYHLSKFEKKACSRLNSKIKTVTTYRTSIILYNPSSLPHIRQFRSETGKFLLFFPPENSLSGGQNIFLFLNTNRRSLRLS